MKSSDILERLIFWDGTFLMLMLSCLYRDYKETGNPDIGTLVMAFVAGYNLGSDVVLYITARQDERMP